MVLAVLTIIQVSARVVEQSSGGGRILPKRLVPHHPLASGIAVNRGWSKELHGGIVPRLKSCRPQPFYGVRDALSPSGDVYRFALAINDSAAKPRLTVFRSAHHGIKNLNRFPRARH
ncbi:MAG TPA: hypothetical protein VMP01_02810 [Pirellulaceae bacterium]|nr:hypothetical protein [Pirellulaceae bacterium]